MTWNALKPETVPWKDLVVVEGEKMHPHLIVAGAIARGFRKNKAFQKMTDAMKFYDAFIASLQKMTGKTFSIADDDDDDRPPGFLDITIEDFTTREFTASEANFYNATIDKFAPVQEQTAAGEGEDATRPKEKYPVYPAFDARWLVNEIEFTGWDPTDMSTVPFAESKVSDRMKIQPHVAMAACYAERYGKKIDKEFLSAAQSTLAACKRRMASLQKEFPAANKVEDFLSRPFTEEEKEYFETNQGYLPGMSAPPCDPKQPKAAVAANQDPPRRSDRAAESAKAQADAAAKAQAGAAAKASPAIAKAKAKQASTGCEGGLAKRRRGEQCEEPAPAIRTVVASRKRKGRDALSDPAEVVVTAQAIPISEKSGRVLLSRTELGQVYSPGFMSDNPAKPLPPRLEGAATLGSMFQLVRYQIIHIFWGPDVCLRSRVNFAWPTSSTSPGLRLRLRRR